MQQDPNPSDERPFHQLDERRMSTRIRKEPDTDFVAVWTEDDQLELLEVHDESLGGLCLVVEDLAQYAIGSEAEFIYHGSLLRATVRHVEARADGTCLVGFECQPLV